MNTENHSHQPQSPYSGAEKRQDAQVNEGVSELNQEIQSVRSEIGSFYDPCYRKQVFHDLLTSLQCDSSVFYDDIYYAVDEHQRASISGLAGYMRCALPAAEAACLAPAHILCLAPPYPAELEYALQFVEEYGGDPSNLHVWLKAPDSGELLDLAAIVLDNMRGSTIASEGMARYEEAIRYTVCNGAEFEPDQYINLYNDLKASGRLPGSKALILPFQTRDLHRGLFEEHIANEDVVFTSSADKFRDKVEAAQRLITVDPDLSQYLTNPVPVRISRRPQENEVSIEMISELIQALPMTATSPNNLRINLGESLSFVIPETHWSKTFDAHNLHSEGIFTAICKYQELRSCAEQIVSQMIAKEEGGKKAYLKLDATGVSGVDNLNPSQFPRVYEGSKKTRIDALNQILFERFAFSPEESLPTASIEDRVQRGWDEFGVQEYILSGIQNGNGFKQWCVVRAINDVHDVYQGVIGCTDPTRIGISTEMAEEMQSITCRIADAMAHYDYKYGYISKDFMYDESDHRLKINDHNDRRGGRSHLERVLTINPNKVLMDRDFTFDCPSSENPIEYSMRLLDKAKTVGISAYGTPMMFFPIREGDKHIVKLKFVVEVPQDIIDASIKSKGLIVELMDERVRELLEV